MREDHQNELSRLTLDLEDESSRTTSMDRRLTDLRREVRNHANVQVQTASLDMSVTVGWCFDCGSVLGYYFDIKLNIGEIERESNRGGGGGDSTRIVL